MNHQNDFKNPTGLAQTLRQACQKMTKLHTESTDIEHPIQEAEDAVQAMDIKTWSGTDECAQHLSDLLCTKREVLIRKSMNLHAWPNLYLSQPAVQKYLRSVMEANQDANSGDTEYIKLLMSYHHTR